MAHRRTITAVTIALAGVLAVPVLAQGPNVMGGGQGPQMGRPMMPGQGPGGQPGPMWGGGPSMGSNMGPHMGPNTSPNMGWQMWGGGPQQGSWWSMWNTWGPQNMADRIDGRLAFIKAELKITEAQTAAWTRFADAIKVAAQRMSTQMQERMSGSNAAQTLGDRLERQENALSTRLEEVKQIRAAYKDLAAALTDAQKKEADQILLPMTGMGTWMGQRMGHGFGPMAGGANQGMHPGPHPGMPQGPMINGPMNNGWGNWNGGWGGMMMGPGTMMMGPGYGMGGYGPGTGPNMWGRGMMWRQ